MRTPRPWQRKGSIPRNTFAAVVHIYLASPKFLALGAETQKNYRRLLLLAAHPTTLGAKDVHELRPSLMQRFLDGLAEYPGKQSQMQAVLHAVEQWAVVRDLLPYPIMTGTEVIGSDGGHEPWSDAQVITAEQHAHSAYSRAISLAANTGQRGSDLYRMHPNDLEEIEGHLGINVHQRKTGKRLWIPFTRELIAVMATWPRTAQPFLLKPSGEPWGNRKQLSTGWQRERDSNPQLGPCAGLVLHGLRATACIRHKRGGASEILIGDMVGMSPQMVHHYCRFADQRQNALAAVYQLDRTASERESNIATSAPVAKLLK